MRRFLHRNGWATTLVVGLFLLATSGLSVSRMTCLMSGRTVVSWGMASDCCPESDGDAGPQVKAQCCLFAAANSEHQDYVLPVRIVCVPAFAALDATPVLHLPTGRILAARAMDDDPPPIGVPDRLALLGTLRI